MNATFVCRACRLESMNAKVNLNRFSVGSPKGFKPSGGKIQYLWSAFLADCVACETVVQAHKSLLPIGLSRLRLNETPSFAAKLFDSQASRTIVVLQIGAWFSAHQLLQYRILARNQTTTDGDDDDLIHQTMHLFKHNVDRFFNTTMKSFAGKLIVMSVSPAHDACQQNALNTDHRAQRLMMWHKRGEMNDYLQLKATQFGALYLDIYHPSLSRVDGHPGFHHPNPQERSKANDDCMHWCSPVATSVINSWIDLLTTALRQHFPPLQEDSK
jgi:hypothetical protein